MALVNDDAQYIELILKSMNWFYMKIASIVQKVSYFLSALASNKFSFHFVFGVIDTSSISFVNREIIKVNGSKKSSHAKHN